MKKALLLNIKTRIANKNDDDKKVRVWIDILDGDQQLTNYYAKEVVVPAGETTEIELPTRIEKPILFVRKLSCFHMESSISFNV